MLSKLPFQNSVHEVQRPLKLKVTLNPIKTIFNFAKSFTVPLLKYKRLNLKLNVVLIGHTVFYNSLLCHENCTNCSAMTAQCLFQDCNIN